MRVRRWKYTCGQDWEVYDDGYPSENAPANWPELCPECDKPGKLAEDFNTEDLE